MNKTYVPSRISLPSQSEQLVSFFVSASVEDRRKETIEAWDEIAPTLSSATRELAQQFVDLCKEKGAFSCDPMCHIDDMECDQIMFDWNNGQLPIFSVLIGPDPPLIAFAGQFLDGEITGEMSTFDLLEAPLDKLTKEIGTSLWTTPSLHDSSTLIASVTKEVDEPHSTLHTPTGSYLSSPQTTPPNEISWPQGLTSPEKGKRITFSGGRA